MAEEAQIILFEDERSYGEGVITWRETPRKEGERACGEISHGEKHHVEGDSWRERECM